LRVCSRSSCPPAKEIHLKSRTEFLAELATLLGGYSAEQIVFHEVTTGAASDLEKASELARKLVKEYGMSKKLGPVAFGEQEELVFLGKEIGEQRNYSETVAAKIDEEVAQFIKEAQVKAKKILTQRRKILDRIAKVLTAKETIEREEFEQLIGNKRGKTRGSRKVKLEKFEVKPVK